MLSRFPLNLLQELAYYGAVCPPFPHMDTIVDTITFEFTSIISSLWRRFGKKDRNLPCPLEQESIVMYLEEQKRL